jgi:hypothetical protein
MPIDYARLTLITDFVLLAPETTVRQAYLALTADSAIEQRRFSYLLLPAFPGFVVVRWNEIELIAALSGQNITGLAILDLPRLQVAAGYHPDPATLPEKSQEQSLADLLHVLQPARVIDQQHTTTQEATEYRDQHPGRRVVVRANGTIKGLLTIELLGVKSVSESLIRKLIRSAGAILGTDTTAATANQAGMLAPAAQVPQAEWHPYLVEAAMPETGQVGRTTEVWVKFSLPKGTNLADELPDYTLAGDKVEQESVIQADTELEFAADRTTVYVAIEAPHFVVPPEPRAVQVRRGHVSTTTKILLTPTIAAENSLVNVHVYQDATTKAVIATITLAISITAGDTAESSAPTIVNLLRTQVIPVAGQADVAGAVQVIYVAGDYIAGDNVTGDKITVGDIHNASGIAIGAGSQASVGKPAQP